MNIGILALQGGFEAHARSIRACGANVLYLKKAEDFKDLDGLILPGGESTTHHILLEKYNIVPKILEIHKSGKPILGTCAGSILISNLKLIDIEINRNAYGSQKFSFETELSLPELDIQTFRGVFIRAPKILNTPSDTKVLCTHQDLPVMVQKDNVIAITFHPELTEDTRIHQYFLKHCK